MREELGAGAEGGGRAFQNKSLGKQKENIHQVEEKGRRRKTKAGGRWNT